MNLIGVNNPGGEPLPDLDDERFAAALVIHGNNATEAYLAVRPDTTAARPSIWAMACRWRGRPDISMRYNQLRAASLAVNGIDLASLVADIHDIATADPNELVRPIKGCCRHCHGIGYKYQWRDADEYVAACDAIEQANEDKRNAAPPGARIREKALPDFEGGEGFNPHTHPNPACPECMGVGTTHVMISDTTQLSPKAAKLYKGIKMTSTGPEILMHDQQAARDMLNRMAGVYKDAPPLPGGSADGGVPEGVALEDAGDVYMQLVHGGPPA